MQNIHHPDPAGRRDCMRNLFHEEGRRKSEVSSKAGTDTQPAALQNGGGQPFGSCKEEITGKMGIALRGAGMKMAEKLYRS